MTRPARLPKQEAEVLFGNIRQAIGRGAVILETLEEARMRSGTYSSSLLNEALQAAREIDRAWRALLERDIDITGDPLP